MLVQESERVCFWGGRVVVFYLHNTDSCDFGPL